MSTTEDPIYICVDGASLTCPETCVSLQECENCECAVEDTEGGPWGKAMDVILCLLPIMFLLVVTLIPRPLPTTQSLPLAALIMLLVRLMYLGSDPLLCCASIISGLHEALAPITIIGGAMLLFETLEATLCLPYIMREMKALTQGHHVAELMLVFAFAYMIEGASGFGTPVAISAPMLVSLGYPKYESVVTLLLMNTFATVWGAVGTPIWFGFSPLDLSDADFIQVSYKSGVGLAISAFLILPFIMLITCPWKILKENIVFFLLSMTSTVGPAMALSFVSYEFPSLLGGMLGCCLTACLIFKKVGLKDVEHVEDETGRHPLDIGTTSDAHSVIAKYVEERNSLRNSNDLKVSWEQNQTEKTKDESTDTREENTVGVSKVTDTVAENQSIHIDNVKTGDSREENGTNDSDENESDEENPDKVDSAEKCNVDKFKSAGPSFNFDEKPDSLRDSEHAIELFLGERKKFGEGYIKELILRTFPLWGTVLILILTRVPQIGLRDLLTRREPSFSIYFQTYGTFKCSASLVLQLNNILTYPNLNWKYELLYVPCLIPFCLVSFIAMYVFRKDLQSSPGRIVGVVCKRMKNPAIALFGALVLVQLMINGGQASPAFIIGSILAEAFKGGWIAIAALIGALGSFFSGSTTVSNLTFGEIQEIAAETIGVSTTAMLAIQATGASAGNGVCLNNIIAACTVVGLNISEGKVIGKTWKVVLAICVIATLSILAFFIRF